MRAPILGSQISAWIQSLQKPSPFVFSQHNQLNFISRWKKHLRHSVAFINVSKARQKTGNLQRDKGTKTSLAPGKIRKTCCLHYCCLFVYPARWSVKIKFNLISWSFLVETYFSSWSDWSSGGISVIWHQEDRWFDSPRPHVKCPWTRHDECVWWRKKSTDSL